MERKNFTEMRLKKMRVICSYWRRYMIKNNIKTCVKKKKLQAKVKIKQRKEMRVNKRKIK